MKETLQDEYAGQGGSYVMQDGKRVRVEETVEHQDGNRARAADGKPVGSGVEETHGASAAPAAAPAAETAAPPARSKSRTAKTDIETTGS